MLRNESLNRIKIQGNKIFFKHAEETDKRKLKIHQELFSFIDIYRRNIMNKLFSLYDECIVTLLFSIEYEGFLQIFIIKLYEIDSIL